MNSPIVRVERTIQLSPPSADADVVRIRHDLITMAVQAAPQHERNADDVDCDENARVGAVLLVLSCPALYAEVRD